MAQSRAPTQTPATSVAGGNIAKQGESSGSNFSRNTKWLSEDEARDKREKGLCYRCDGQWSKGQRCRNLHLKLIIVSTEKEKGEDDGVVLEGEEMVEGAPGMLLSVISLMGLTAEDAMWVKGTVAGEEVVVMVDSGASANFVRKEVARRLNLKISPTRKYTVAMGNGLRVSCEGICRRVTLQVQGITLTQDFYFFDLDSSADFVLGMVWLKSLGDFMGNFQKYTITFQ